MQTTKPPRTASRAANWRSDISGLSGAAAVLTLFLLVIGGILLLWDLNQLARARAAVRMTFAAQQSTRIVLRDVLNAETGQRGFLLTGEPRYLAPYQEARSRIWADFDNAQEQAVDGAARASLDRIRPLIRAKLAELADTLSLRARSFDTALAVVKTDVGQHFTEQIRDGVEELEQREQQLVEQRLATLNVRMRTTTYVALACGVLAFLSAAFVMLNVIRYRNARLLAEQNARLEREVAERTAELECINEELESFASAVSHDLRAPVRAAEGYARALQEDAGSGLNEEQQGFLQRIVDISERMDGLIDDILAYSRMARTQLARKRVLIEDVLEEALDLHRATILKTGARIEVASPLPIVRAHSGALGEVLSNLIGNALKFVAPGQSPTLRIWAEPPKDNMVRVWVADEGIGIAASQQEQVFRPFKRLHGRETYPGTGVGLAVVQRVMEKLGGRCGVIPALAEEASSGSKSRAGTMTARYQTQGRTA